MTVTRRGFRWTASCGWARAGRPWRDAGLTGHLEKPAPKEIARGASVVVAAGWADAQTLLLDAVFADTAHRLSLVCDTRSMTFTAHWRTTPLDASRLRDLLTPSEEPVVLDVAPQ
jgi:hypothetical protein